VRPKQGEGVSKAGWGSPRVSVSQIYCASEPPVTASQPANRRPKSHATRLRTELRDLTARQDAQRQEAQAINEELRAMNEELRTSADTLEQNKRDLESLNVELTAVNEQLQVKVAELGLTNNHISNLINSTDIGTIFVDRSLRVKFATPEARRLFNLKGDQISRPIGELTHSLRDAHLQSHVARVLDRVERVEQEVESEDGHWHLMQVLPYRTTDDRIEGAVLTFQDISARRQAQQQVRRSEEHLRLLIDSATDYAIFTVNDAGVIDSWNAGAERLFGYRAHEIVGSGIDILYAPDDRAARVPERELDEARAEGRAADERYLIRRDGSPVYVSGVMNRLGDGTIGFAKIARDLTHVQETRLALERANADANRRVFELLRKSVSAQEDERRRLSRDLHDGVGQQLTALRLALERLDPSSSAVAATALELTAAIGREIDFMAWQLRPAVLDELGLAAALPRFVGAWTASTGVPAECRVDGYQPGVLTSEAEVALFRIVQEALHNAAKHASASRVDVVLTSGPDDVSLLIEDDGVGFDLMEASNARRGFGLESMRERAQLIGAAFDVESTPGQGTSIFLRYQQSHHTRGGAP